MLASKQLNPAAKIGLPLEFGLSPVPQHIEIRNDEFALQKGMILTLDSGDPRCTGACEEVLGLIESKTGEKPQFRLAKDGGRHEICLKHLRTVGLTSVLETGTDREEGYTLQITPSEIVIRGVDPAGLFYGTQSLILLLESARESLKSLFIDDWPDMGWRGYCPFFGGHSFNKDAGNPLRYKEIAKSMARAKLNRMGFESEAFADDGELRQFGEFCRASFIEPIPLHPFLCIHDRNIVKYVKASDEEFTALMRPAERAIKLLQPRFFGIAGDELVSSYDHVNRKSIYKPEHLKEHPAHEWLALCLNRIHDYLKEGGVRMAVWADGLLASEKFWGHGCEMKDFNGGLPDNHHLAVDLLPKDILMWDWQYMAGREYASMNYLLSKGFQTIGCPILTGLSEKAFTEYADAIGDKKILGMMSLTWRNKGPDEFFKKEDILACGDCFWSVGRYAVPIPAVDSFKEVLKTPNPLLDIPVGKGTISIKGAGEKFVIYSAGRIYCSILPNGLGTWRPGMNLSSDMRFQISACGNAVFARCHLELKLSGKAKSSVAVASDCMEEDFEKICEICFGETTKDIELTGSVRRKNSFCVWIRAVGVNIDKLFLEEFSLKYEIEQPACDITITDTDTSTRKSKIHEEVEQMEIKYQQLSREDALKTYADWLVEHGIKSPEFFFDNHGEWYMLSYPLRALMIYGKLYKKPEYISLAFKYVDIYLGEQLPNSAFTSDYRRQPTEKLTKKEFEGILRKGKVNIADVGSNMTWIIQAATYADKARKEKYLGAAKKWLDNWVPIWALPEGGYGNGIWGGQKLNAPYTCAMSTLVMALSAFSLVTGEDEYVGNAERCMEFQCSKWLDNGLPLFLNCYPWIREQFLDDYSHSYYLLEGMCWTHYVSRNEKIRKLIEKRMGEMIFGKKGLLSQWKASWFSFTNAFQPLPIHAPSDGMVSSRAGCAHGWELAKSNGIMHTFLYYLNHIEDNPSLREKTELGLKYLSHPLKARMSGVASEIEEGYGKYAMQATGFAGLSLLESIKKDSVFALNG